MYIHIYIYTCTVRECGRIHNVHVYDGCGTMYNVHVHVCVHIHTCMVCVCVCAWYMYIHVLYMSVEGHILLVQWMRHLYV